MSRLLSRKLFGSVAAMAIIAAIVLGAAQIGNVTDENLRIAMGLVAVLGGYQVMRQANKDDRS